jgi:hypothetical protein
MSDEPDFTDTDEIEELEGRAVDAAAFIDSILVDETGISFWLGRG